MIVRAGMGSRALGATALGLVLVASATAGAQTLSTPTFVNGSNPNELFLGSSSVPSYERETSTSVVASSPGGAFTTRFAALVTADGDGTSGAGRAEVLFVDYTVQFTATAPGAYTLTVDTELSGDLHLVNDGANGATAQIGNVSGFSTGGTVIGGDLDLPSASIVSTSSGTSANIAETKTATIFAVSNGAPVAHTLTFQWSNTATTPSIPGDEAAVRLGGTSDIPTETAGDYPGSPVRVQADDGHFVTVTIASLCGNGTIDSGPSYTEDCDEGPANGTAASCCTASCTFKTDGSSCDDGDTCTQGDACTSGTCAPTSQQICDVCQICDPMGGCVTGPRTACKQDTLPKKSSLVVKDKSPDTGDQVVFKWVKGQATTAAEFGNPVMPGGPSYALCVFDQNDALVFKSTAPVDGVCGSRPCWKALGTNGFSYKDSARTPDGADKVLLRAGLQGKAKVQYKGKGDNLPPFALPVSGTLKVQLQSSQNSASCWEATFGQFVSTNTAQQFTAKAD